MSNMIDRREFLRKGSSAVLGVGAVCFSRLHPKKTEPHKAEVAEVTHSKAVRPDRKIDPVVVKDMLTQGMRSLTELDNPWGKFIKSTDKICLKINPIGSPILYTHVQLVKAVIEELRNYGIDENNIIVWDRSEKQMRGCGFSINTSKRGVRYYAGNSVRDRFDKKAFYESKFDNPEDRKKGRTISYIYKIITEECDKVINMPILKHHGLSGVTLCLKNMAYGFSENNSRFHGPKHIGPFISDICALPEIKEKVIFHILDGLEGRYNGGPIPKNLKFIFSPQTLWLGTDPVAIDSIGFQAINKKRREMRIPTLEETGRPIDHINLAAKKGLGVSNLDQIKVKRVELG